MTTASNAPSANRWMLMRAESGDQRAIYRVLKQRPEGHLVVRISIAWNYEGDAQGFPMPDVRAAMDELEDATAELTCARLALVITGMGRKEWSFYTGSTDRFLEEFNAAMRGRPHAPVTIASHDDQDWQYWWNVRKHAQQAPPQE
jgi:hypothetical protein